ncbi:MAG: Flp pilus assembly complex ATPase component TadA, partial [Myxococcales bacterium]|nr:Flp pilus assembly complex ATPase component TadA [Myxococcales bacterium]
MARKKLGELLVEEGAVARAHLDEALSQPGETRIGERLVDMGVVADEAVARALARQLGLPYVDPLQARVDHSLLRRLPQPMISGRRVLPLTLDDGVLTVAVSDPLNLSLVDDLQFIFHARVKAQVAAPSKLRRAFDREGDLAPHAQRMLAGVRPLGEVDGDEVLRLDEAEIVRRLEAGGQRPYVDLASLLIVQAANRGASDIHLEPQSDGLRVRMRTDGMLRVVLSLPRWSAGPLVSRIKVLAELDVANHRTPQDGKFRVHVQGRRVDLRVAVVPSQFGEKVVIRLLDPRMLQTDLGTLGWEPRALQQYYHMVSRPRGLVLCVGPTGSGK